ncbi:Tryptophan synthase alpha chain [Vulgatibacter incomptus]|uniref:Tryptophan synthase alpha chain n=1 Tax=Vulgatibacter incomptus TaxID=1391653 RepID=A0A0K1PI25_9BACT|nr:Tryptophan synthase alpha chain [Vulgatibacter incomptus]
MSCHSSTKGGGERGGAPTTVDLDNDGDVLRHADKIRSTVFGKGTMPPARPLDSCERAALETYLSTLEQGRCIPSCTGRVCGDDGCGGTCGTCKIGEECTAEGKCEAKVCTPDCDGKSCGSDGCGGSCGTCADGFACSAEQLCACETGNCGCTPDCDGKSCGPDGCDGTCGTCGNQQECDPDQKCAWQAKSYAADVAPIFAAKTCANGGCHARTNPQDGLDLSTASAGFAGMVDKHSHCAGKLLVNAGDVTGSYLVNKLTGQGMCSGARMPKNTTPLSPGQIDVVRAWIGSGAAP